MADLKSMRFLGEAREFVLIVAGIHASELSGIEVANWLNVRLMRLHKRTHYGAIIIPEVFPNRATLARKAQARAGDASPEKLASILSDYREQTTNGKTVYVARQFPPPGLALSHLKDDLLRDRLGNPLEIDGHQVELLPEMKALVRTIEQVKPIRIVSIHAKRPPTTQDITGLVRRVGPITQEVADIWDGKQALKGANWWGIFVDPRYEIDNRCERAFDVEDCKFDKSKDAAFRAHARECTTAWSEEGKFDDALALKAAMAVGDNDLVAGNHIDDPPQVVHYAREAGTPLAYSLGDWGPVAVTAADRDDPGTRPAAPVFTFEVQHYAESWAFKDGVQIMEADGTKEVSKQLQPKTQGSTGQLYALHDPRPRFFNAIRSKQLQRYADAIIAAILEIP